MGAASAKADPDQQLRIERQEGISDAQNLANVSIDPAANAALTVLMFNRGSFGKTGVSETFEALRQATRKVHNGDMTGPEAMLVTQADSLNAIFTELARRSALNMGEYIEASEKYMRLALKAQAQCRATIETLATLKNPPLVIAKQANFSAGPQQVNNGSAAPRAEVSSNQPNELLEHHHEQRLDPGAATAPGRSDPTLVPLEKGNRASNVSRKGIL